MLAKLARKITALWEKAGGQTPFERSLEEINRRRAELESASKEALAHLARVRPLPLEESFALSAVAAERVLGLRAFDVQLLGALAMANGKIAEMQTGEGKTLTAVLTVAWLVSQGAPVHVLTANDYLARRDAEWMGGIYRLLGLSTGYITQTMAEEDRRAAYACDITYATPNEVGFDYLRDGLALDPAGLVHRDFGAALIDEADSILIDEARIPLVIAGGEAPAKELVRRLAGLARALRRYEHYSVDEHARNVLLTDAGAAVVEAALGCGNLYDEHNLGLFTALSDALHAEVLLRRDVDYILGDGAIQLVDEFKGRVAVERRWPAGLQTALEAKEGLDLRTQGRILGSITLQSLVGLYEFVCGMTGTAATQAEEFRQVFGLDVVVIPTNRPVIRLDQPDIVFPARAQRDAAVADEIRRAHQAGRPVLVGTASVADSERLSRKLAGCGIPHHVLNARNDTEEAAIVARAGERGAVTISTNMAGRGTDIRLGGGVAELGGLYVIGTTRHEARRIDHQLRGRAGRQGDAGESRFFLSRQDDLVERYGLGQAAHAMDHVQRVIEGANLEIRKTLWKYDRLIEQQRRMVYEIRRQVLVVETECAGPRAAMLKIDELWSDYLADVAEMKSGIHWISFGGKNPLDTFLHEAAALFAEVERRIEAAIQDPAGCGMPDSYQRGATWTYVTTDQPLGDMNQRLARGIVNRVRELLRTSPR